MNDTRTQREKLLELEVLTWPPGKQAMYRRSRRQGNTIPMAHMLASRETGFFRNSDSIFNASQHDLMTRHMTEANREQIVGIAQAAGINTHGKTYFGQLGQYDDPAAWVSGIDDVTANLKKKGRNADGLIRVRGERNDGPPPKPPRLSRSLINECVAETLRVEPKTREKLRKGKIKRKDLEARVIDRHGRKVD